MFASRFPRVALILDGIICVGITIIVVTGAVHHTARVIDDMRAWRRRAAMALNKTA